jgi:predicted nucleic acid-binding protein
MSKCASFILTLALWAKLILKKKALTLLNTLRNDFIDNPEVLKIEATNDLCMAAMPSIEKHSINATDSLVLHTARGIAATESKDGNDLILITADKRLVTAAKAEGLQVINPETATLAEIDKLLKPEPPPAQNAT